VAGTPGLLPVVPVTAANRGDGAVAPEVPAGWHADESPRPSAPWADKEYRDDDLGARPAARPRRRAEVASKPEGPEGFEPLAGRRGWSRRSGAGPGPGRWRGTTGGRPTRVRRWRS
jgi:hypothetical protein